MFKRIAAWALCLCLVLGLLPGADAFGREPIAPGPVDQCCTTLRVNPLDPNYVRPSFDGKLIEITPDRVEDTFEYLQEHYEEDHPEQALAFYTGTEEDRENLRKLAETITAGCKTDREKADAIDRWLDGNISYDENTSAYASDTFYRREGNCLSYANLMMFLLRSLGIPAVVGDGWRGDMKEWGVELFDYVGHAWCFVLLDGEWVLYDPLWLDGGTTDRKYMAEWIYFDTVEFVTPAEDEDELPPVAYDKSTAYWVDGEYVMYSEKRPQGVGTLTCFVNNQAYVFVSYQGENGYDDGWYYIEDGKSKDGMMRGELYRDGWVSYGDYNQDRSMLHAYAFPNGMMPDGYTVEFDNTLWYMSYNSAVPILMDEEDYWIQDGLVTLRPGYSGPFLGLCWQEGAIHPDDEDRFVTYTAMNPNVATIDDNGNITCHSEGYAEFYIELSRRESDGSITMMGNDFLQIFVSSEDRTPDYRDLSDHTHDMKFLSATQPGCEEWGMEIYKCSGCSYTEERAVTAPLGHDHSSIEVIAATCTEGGFTRRTCRRCGDSYTENPTPIDPNNHAWDEYECTRCGVTRKTLFDDVVPGAFYEEPVAWAQEGGITNGISADEFGSLGMCSRSQVVTFLWRAMGSPEPKSMDNPFVDVQKGSFYEKPVLWAVEMGITNGVDATHFGPNEACNRATVVTFLWRAAGKPAPASADNSFADVPAGTWYTDPVLWAVEMGITNGTGVGQFSPNDRCNRAQVVTFLWRDLADAE